MVFSMRHFLFILNMFATVAASAKFVYLSSNRTDFFKYILPILFKTQLKHVP